MKQLVLVVMLVLCLVGVSYAADNITTLTLGHYLTTSGTYSWISAPVETKGYEDILLLVDLTINNGTDVTIQPIGMRTYSDTELYTFPIKSSTSTQTNISPLIWVITDDTNGNIALSGEELCNMPFVRFRAKCTYSSGTASAIDAYCTRNKK